MHQVRKNDTLYSISWHYNQDYHQVAQWNGLEPPYIIKEGQWLRVAPPLNASHTEQKKTSTSSQPVSRPPSVAPAKPSAAPPPRSSKSAPIAETSTVLTWQWPVRGRLLQKYDASKPGKQGIDIAAAAGTPVQAAAPGKVVYSGSGLRGYGNLIIIKHNEKFLSAYAHNRSLDVKQGDQVRQGEQIASVGDTESTQVKLHFQIRVDGKPVDPLRYLPK